MSRKVHSELKLKNAVICAVIFFGVFGYCLGRAYDGDKCTERHTKGQGVCKKINDCKTAKDYYIFKRIRLELCYFEFDEPVVCCLDGTELDRYSATPRPTTTTAIPKQNTKRPEIQILMPMALDPVYADSGQRISEKKCDDFQGRINSRSPKFDFHIAVVGGAESTIEELPFMAAIGWTTADYTRFKWLCGGSLISEQFILTAAHCTFSGDTDLLSGSPSVAALGDKNLKDRTEISKEKGIFKIVSIIKHPAYKAPVKYADLAIMKLESEIRYSDRIRPACLWTGDDNFEHLLLTAAGWGLTHDKDEKTSDVLMKVDLAVFKNDECEANFQRNRNWKGFTDELMCAGDSLGGKDTCQGDSGGPLVNTVRSNYKTIKYIVSVLSFGVKCGAAKGSGVYTKVANYLDWIESVVWP